MAAVAELERGREAYARRAWLDAFDALSRADADSPLDADDLSLLSTSAALTGHRVEHHAALERIYRLRLDNDELHAAARAALMLGMSLAIGGEVGPAMGWIGRAQQLIEQAGNECVEQGWLLVPVVFRSEAAGELDHAYRAASRAAAIGARFGDADLFALASTFSGSVLIKQGQIDAGLRQLDEAMVGVTAGEVSPFFAGVIYCGVIASCEEAFEARRAHEWTNALTRWCDAQPQLVAFTGRCLAHRAGIKQRQGAWADALEEAALARERSVQATNRPATGQAWYQQGELHRLRGDFAAAEAAYREASACGREPQPGLALLRLAQGDAEASAAAINRSLAETTEPLQRAVLLPAYVEILLARGLVDEAVAASEELDQVAETADRTMLLAIAAQVRGAVKLARGEPQAALRALRRAWQVWDELDAPYEGARVRVLIGLACRALGDEDGANLEFDSSRTVFERLGAAPDVARVDGLRDGAPAATHGLSDRELEVLRLVAAGKTNRQIATELVVSEHTVARHVQNIFSKLGVSSRTAAAALAFEHDLV